MRFKSWECMTDEEKVAQVRREVEAGASADGAVANTGSSFNTEPLPPLGEPHKEVWLVQAFDESDEDSAPLFSYAFTDGDVAIKVRELGLSKIKQPYLMWTLERVVLDAAEDAEWVIDEMVAIDAGRRDEQ
jgi:hypothetical protein